MYILVQHTISDPAAVWPRAQQALPGLPSNLKLHQSFPTADGRKAVCVWEAPSIEALRSALDPALGDGAKNDYAEAVNKEGVGMPAFVQQTA